MEKKKYWRGEWWWMCKDAEGCYEGGYTPLRRVKAEEILMDILKEIKSWKKSSGINSHEYSPISSTVEGVGGVRGVFVHLSNACSLNKQKCQED